MRPANVQFPPTKQKTILLTGGLNEQVSNLELGPGELTSCLNYEEIDGAYHGYRSWSGFERWDGSIGTIEFPVGSGDWSDVQYPSDVNVTFITGTTDPLYTISEDLYTESDDPLITEDSLQILTEDYYGDTERELRRSQIQPTPGVGPLLYCGFYKNRIYTIREGEIVGSPGAGTGFVKLYMMEVGETTGSGGYVEITEFPVDIPVNDVYTNPYRDASCRFAEWPSSDPNTKSLALCQGLYESVLLHRDESDVHIVEKIDDVNLPVGIYPEIPVFFENRIYLSYEGGHLLFSNLATPTFDAVSGFAGEYYFGSQITDMVSSPGDAIVVWMEEGIKILKSIEPSAGNDYASVVVESFSEESSSKPKTAKRFLGTLIYCDDRGVTTMETTSAFGDFKAASISKRVQQTYQLNSGNIFGSIVDREKNQYVVLFKNGSGLAITFDVEKKVKGSTYFDIAHSPTCYSYGKDHTDSNQIIFGDSDGYVQFYRDQAESFDGVAINTRLNTSFYHYGSVVNYKTFRKILLELSGQFGLTLYVTTYFDYRNKNVPRGITQETLGDGAGGIWSDAIWGAFLWSGSSIDQADIYITGVGVNMSIAITTSSKYNIPHTIHNATVNYTMRSIKY